VQNPYLDEKEGWWPVGSAANSDRNREGPGLITTRSKAFAIFTRHGWVWGGLFRGNPDYMHFEKATIGAHPDPTDVPIS
jgi:D-alanyl-D-alanine carboxypeptidase